MDKSSVNNDFIQQIVESYGDMILRIAFQNLKNKENAEDVVQEALLRLVRQRFTGSEPYIKAWLIRVTINLCSDYRKSAWFRKVAPLSEEWAPHSEEDRGIFDELWKLPVHYRNVIYLHYYEGYTIAEIAEILNKNPKTIGTQLIRARKRLKDTLIEGGFTYE